MEHVEICDIGKVREINQDAILAVSREKTGLFAVADGMGGYNRGEEASQYIIQVLENWWVNFRPEYFEDDYKRMIYSLKQQLEQINRDIYQNYNNGSICGATVVILFVYQDMYGIIYAGDSRAYLYWERQIKQLTIDEVWENQPALTIREKKKNWKQCHGKLVNAIGIREEMQCRIITDKVEKNMIFLLCSDGLYKYCPEKYLRKYLKKTKREELEYICADLLDEVYRGEAKDNVSIVLVKI